MSDVYSNKTNLILNLRSGKRILLEFVDNDTVNRLTSLLQTTNQTVPGTVTFGDGPKRLIIPLNSIEYIQVVGIEFHFQSSDFETILKVK